MNGFGADKRRGVNLRLFPPRAFAGGAVTPRRCRRADAAPPPRYAVFSETASSCLRSNEMYGFSAMSKPERNGLYAKQLVDSLWLCREWSSGSKNPYISFDLKQQMGYFGNMSMYSCSYVAFRQVLAENWQESRLVC